MNRSSALVVSVFVAVTVLAAGCGKKEESKQKPDEASAKLAKEKAPEPRDTPGERAHRDRPVSEPVGEAETAAVKAPDDNDTADQAAPSPKDEEAQKLLAEFGPQVEAFMSGVIKAVDDAKGNCADFAGPVTKVFNDNAGVLAKMKDTDKTEAAATWKREHADLMRGFGAKMPDVFKCSLENPDLATALQALPR